MSNFSSAFSAQEKATLRASLKPRWWSRWIWMSGTGCLLEVLGIRERGAQRLVPLWLGLLRQLSYGIIKPGPVAALSFEQGFERGHQFIVGSLGGKAGVVGLGHPAVIARHLGGGGLGCPPAGCVQPLRAQGCVTGAESLHCFTFHSC